MLLPFVFPPRRHPAPDVAFLLVFLQHLPDLKIQGVVILLQPVGQIFMYGGFGNAEVPGGGPDGGTGFNHVYSHFARAFFHGFFHRHPSDVSVLTEKTYARSGKDMHS